MYLDLDRLDISRYRTLDLLKEAENDRLADLARAATASTSRPRASRPVALAPAAWLVSLLIRWMHSAMVPANKGVQ
jgi:hypothetical protein